MTPGASGEWTDRETGEAVRGGRGERDRGLHRRSPAEHDIAHYFRLTPPAVHGMVVKLDELGLITREPGVARSIRVAIPPAEIPELEDVEGPPC